MPRVSRGRQARLPGRDPARYCAFSAGSGRSAAAAPRMGVQFRGDCRDAGYWRRGGSRARQPGNGGPARGAERFSKGSRMIDRSPKPPEALIRAIAQDLRPVRPSPQPLQLALRMVPLALVVSSVILLAIGPRHDLAILGPLLTWGASAAQFA